MQKVMIFGTFDGVHDGHRHFFSEAASRGMEVIAVVTRDEHVLELKGKLPENNLEDRIEMVSFESEINEVIAGDVELGSYGVILEHKPDMILFGYDQDEFRINLLQWLKENDQKDISCEQASAYMEDIFKSSLLNVDTEEFELI